MADQAGRLGKYRTTFLCKSPHDADHLACSGIVQNDTAGSWDMCTCWCHSEIAALKAKLEEAGKREAELREENSNYASVIDETLRLADFLNDIAARGAGFAEHWGERVMQAVEALRNVKSFPTKTLEHNRMLLEHNGKMADRCDNLRQEVERLKGDYLRGRQAEQLARDTVHVAHIESLKAEIAALKAKLAEWQTLLSIAGIHCDACMPDAPLTAAIRAEIEKVRV